MTVYYEGISPTVYAKTSAAPVNAGKYKITVDVAEGAAFSAATGIELGTFTIAKADPVFTVPANLTAVYGDFLDNVRLPDGFSWDSSYPESVKVGNIGTNTFKATFTPEDTDNYNVINNIDVEITVSKAPPVYTVPTGLTATYGDYLHSVILPQGFSWDASYNRSTTVGDAGTNTFKATFTPEDTDNYAVVNNIEVEIAVGKAKPVYTVPTGITAVYGQTLADVRLPEGFAWQVKSPENVKVGNAGKNSFDATFSPKDTKNYMTVSGIKITVDVSKADPTVKKPTLATVVEKTNLTLADVKIPVNGWAWDTPAQAVTNGEAYSASFVPADTENFNTLHTQISVTVSSCAHDGGEGTSVTADTSATCTLDGRYTVVCNRCGKTVVDNVRPATDHSWSAWTDNGNGTHGRICANDTSHTENVPHTFGEWTSNGDATFFSDGTKTHRCSACSASEMVLDEGSAGYNAILNGNYSWPVKLLVMITVKTVLLFMSIC